MEEKEIKIKIPQSAFKRLLAEAKEKLNSAQISDQKDLYFDTPEIYINNLNRGLRIRFENSVAKAIEFKSLFYNKNNHVNNPWFIEEISFPLPLTSDSFEKFLSIFRRLGLPVPNLSKNEYSAETLKEVLAVIGLTPKITVTKHRQIFKNSAADFVFDYIEELGYFLEIETKDGSNPLDLVQKTLGTEPFQFIRNGYNDMVAEDIPYCLSNDIKQQLFRINPKWNILKSETDLVQKLLSD